jgi:hypothetical protein
VEYPGRKTSESGENLGERRKDEIPRLQLPGLEGRFQYAIEIERFNVRRRLPNIAHFGSGRDDRGAENFDEAILPDKAGLKREPEQRRKTPHQIAVKISPERHFPKQTMSQSAPPGKKVRHMPIDIVKHVGQGGEFKFGARSYLYRDGKALSGNFPEKERVVTQSAGRRQLPRRVKQQTPVYRGKAGQGSGMTVKLLQPIEVFAAGICTDVAVMAGDQKSPRFAIGLRVIAGRSSAFNCQHMAIHPQRPNHGYIYEQTLINLK